jgi:ankyrin repeat protein
MEKLLNAGFPLNAKDNRGRTALFYAAEQGQVDIVKFLLRAQADPNLVDNEGNRPYDLARENDQLDVCVLFSETDDTHGGEEGLSVAISALTSASFGNPRILPPRKSLMIDSGATTRTPETLVVS